MNSSLASIVLRSTASHTYPMNVVTMSGIARKASRATASSVERLARSLITFVRASSRWPVVNSWYLMFLTFFCSSGWS